MGGYCGRTMMEWYGRRVPRMQRVIDKNICNNESKGMRGVFACKLLPVVRTLVGLPAGMLGMNLWSYTFASIAGIVIWNAALVGRGYYMGAPLLSYLEK